MSHADFSITYNCLNALQASNERRGKINSFFVTHIGGGLATAVTAGLDTLFHLVATIVKLATGVFATPYAYFSNSTGNWDWSSAGKHFIQTTKHAVAFILAPTMTFLFSPRAALEVLYPEKLELEGLKIKHSNEIWDINQRLQQEERNLEQEKRNVEQEKRNVVQEKRNVEQERRKVGKLEIELRTEKEEREKESFELYWLKFDMEKFNKEKSNLIKKNKDQEARIQALQGILSLEMEHRDKIIKLQAIELTALAERYKKQSAINEQLIIGVNSVADELLCPIDLDLLHDAAHGDSCSHKFNEKMLREHVKNKPNCPTCNAKFKKINVDYTTRSISEKVGKIQSFIEANQIKEEKK